eukprot:gnl/MRDRNA2_/MRDRNA2_90896_c0_seq1.p1 gnl/MRDRNA2_/MRDRNA2_90896_c0~~gnl/MRDRNA2_/MRDRNA2_90896_c0_seq1.p1  ORF type:complete len:748 (+),score=106.79 gnl/MRDRNA2_/MRDRNA2_90896_c0_seq1:50-2245(+)
MPRALHSLIYFLLAVARGQPPETTVYFNPFSTTTTTTNPAQQDSYSITRYNCDTLTCSMYEQDEWEPITLGGNATRDCHSAIADELRTFETELAKECSIIWELRLSGWADCKKNYCQMFQNVLDKIRPDKNQGHYYFDGCEPILNFNYTLCLTEYRDADAVCGCLCHSMHLINYRAACFSQYMGHIVFGKRGFTHLKPTAICTLDLCGTFSKLGDPRVMKTLEGVPGSCQALNLPFDIQSCSALIDTTPYDPCPWVQKTAPVDQLLCTDGTYCSVSGEGSWACCSQSGGRMLCPENYPYMCATPLACVGSSDYCCVESEEMCGANGPRTCSLLLDPVLPEWYGVSWRTTELTQEELAILYPEKYGPEAEYAKKTAGQRRGPVASKEQQDTDFTLYVAIGAGGAALAILFYLMLKIYEVSSKEVAKTENVFEKALQNTAHGDPESQFKPTHDEEKEKKKKPKWYQMRVAPAGMPNLEEAKKKNETQAFQHLRRLTTRIKKRGSISGATEQKELEEVIARAEGQAGAKMGPDDAGNLIAQGKHQLALLAKEQNLTTITKATDLDLAAVSKEYMPARPGGKNVQEMNQCLAEQTQAWQRLDTLRLAAVDAQEAGANPVLLDRAQHRVAEFVGRTVELPEERCVLDPDGKGLRMLQPGVQRATDPYSGEAYCWNVSSYSACYMAREGLGEVDTDAARPLCAAFVAGNCSLGQRCAWRHAKQQPGDRLREPIQLKD